MTDKPVDIKPVEFKPDKESIYGLQCLDCNCNECKHLIRNLAKLNEAKVKIIGLMEDLFNMKKERSVKAAKELGNRNPKKGEQALKAANAMKFTPPGFPNPIMYGTCAKFNKEITFLPGTCQPDTQGCFEHRKPTWDA